MFPFDEFNHAQVGCVNEIFDIAGGHVLADSLDGSGDVVVKRFAWASEGTVMEPTHAKPIPHPNFELRRPLVFPVSFEVLGTRQKRFLEPGFRQQAIADMIENRLHFTVLEGRPASNIALQSSFHPIHDRDCKQS